MDFNLASTKTTVYIINVKLPLNAHTQQCHVVLCLWLVCSSNVHAHYHVPSSSV